MAELCKLKWAEEWFHQKVWFLKSAPEVRITGATLKAEPTGWLLILKAVTAEGPVVAFRGGPRIEQIIRELEPGVKFKEIKWRPDQFAIDK